MWPFAFQVEARLERRLLRRRLLHSGGGRGLYGLGSGLHLTFDLRRIVVRIQRVAVLVVGSPLHSPALLVRRLLLFLLGDRFPLSVGIGDHLLHRLADAARRGGREGGRVGAAARDVTTGSGEVLVVDGDLCVLRAAGGIRARGGCGEGVSVRRQGRRRQQGGLGRRRGCRRRGRRRRGRRRGRLGGRRGCRRRLLRRRGLIRRRRSERPRRQKSCCSKGIRFHQGPPRQFNVTLRREISLQPRLLRPESCNLAL